ncbi:hypothetical protein V866_002782 [Kwoniella sp. B9012]
MIVNPRTVDDLPSIWHHAKHPPTTPPVPSSSLLNSESPKSSGRKLLPELECMIIDELASSSLINLRKVVLLNRTYWQRYHIKLFNHVKLSCKNWKDVGDTAKLLLGPTSSYLDSRDEQINKRRMKRFKAICASIVYLKLKDERGGQALVFSLYYAGPSASSLLPKLRYLILGNRFISCSSFLRFPSEKKNDYGYKALWLISKNVNPEHVCMTMERTWISPTRYRFGLQHLVWLFEHFDQVGSLTQHLDSGKKTRFVMENVTLNRFFIPKYPKEQLYFFAGVGDTNSQWSGGFWPEVEVIYGKPRLRDRLQGFPTNGFTPNNARTIASKEATQCVCCGKKQR